ncbi:MAG: hypothetical protein KDC95_08835 [Planctomycetes bacterium]|nr:hypothetical protein [Planctomycetota bacterium]
MRNRASIFTLIALIALSIFGATTPVRAQKKDDPKMPVERKVVTDEAGLQQWAPHEGAPCPMCRTNKVIDCPTCKDAEHAETCLECGTKKEPRTKKAPCRLCAGEGKLPDMLVEGPCIGCTGAGVFPCVGCRGETSYPVEGGGKKRQKCAVCRGEGSIRCSVCKGKRRCDPISPKKGIADASLKDLEAAAKSIEAVLVELRACEFAGIKERDELKKYQAILKDLAKISKPSKAASSMIKDLIGLASRMDQYTGKEGRKSETFDMFRRYNVYWLEGQAELLKLAIERAKHNENATKK